MAVNNDIDELFSLRNNFYVGNFSACVSEGTTCSPSTDRLKLERDIFVYRAYIAMGNFTLVTEEIGEAPTTDLQAIKLLATYLSQPDSREIALITLKEWCNDASSGNNPTLQLVAGIIYAQEGEMKDALRSLRHGTTLEMVALQAQLYLKMDRLDLAEKQLKIMQEIDDDSTLTQLTTAWVHLAVGGARYQEAIYIFQELIDKFQSSCLLLNALACAHMHLNQYNEAEKCLVDAMGMSSAEPDTLINLIVCSLNLQKAPEVVTRYKRQLKDVAPNHPWLTEANVLEASFEKNACSYAAA